MLLEQERREREQKMLMNGYVGGMDGMCDLLEEWDSVDCRVVNGNGHGRAKVKENGSGLGLAHKKVGSTESESSLGDESMMGEESMAETETSSESDVPLI